MQLFIDQITEPVLLTEQTDKAGNKNLIIHGIFMQAEALNKNGRVYPKHVMESQVKNYQAAISSGQAMGELGHPANPQINLDRVSHLITHLTMENMDVIGKAKILNTPTGQIAKGLMEGGVKLGVSSRGLGSLKEQGGQKIVSDFDLKAIDIVADPSAPKAYVDSLLEGAEWTQDSKGNWIQQFNEEAIKKVRETRKHNREEVFNKLFYEFLFKIK